MKTYQSQNNTSIRRRGNFFSRNMYVLVVSALIVIVATVVTLSIVLQPKKDDIPTVGRPSFVLPLKHYTVLQEVSLDKAVYNPSTNKYRVVTGMTFGAESGEEVLAIVDGTVEAIKKTVLDGRVIRIKHADNVVSIYKSLDTENIVDLKVGDTVKSGDKIGTTSKLLLSNVHFGNQLYLEVKKIEANGKEKFVNPLDYLPQIDK